MMDPARLRAADGWCTASARGSLCGVLSVQKVLSEEGSALWGNTLATALLHDQNWTIPFGLIVLRSAFPQSGLSGGTRTFPTSPPPGGTLKKFASAGHYWLNHRSTDRGVVETLGVIWTTRSSLRKLQWSETREYHTQAEHPCVRPLFSRHLPKSWRKGGNRGERTGLITSKSRGGLVLRPTKWAIQRNWGEVLRGGG